MATEMQKQPIGDIKKLRGRPKKNYLPPEDTEIFIQSSRIGDFKKDLIDPETPTAFIQFYRELTLQEREALIASGITKNQLLCLKKILNTDYGMLANVIGLTVRGLILRKGNDAFSFGISDRIGSILELLIYSIEIFGNIEIAVDWLKSPNALLNDRTPLIIAKSHPGILRLRDLLSHIRIGQF